MLRAEKELNATRCLFICQQEWIGGVVVLAATRSAGESACVFVREHSAGDCIATLRAQWRLVVLIAWHCQLLAVLARRTRVKVVHGHGHHVVARQSDFMVELFTRVARSMNGLRLAVCTVRLVVDGLAIASTPSSKALDALHLIV